MVSRFSSCDPNRLRLLLDDQLPQDTQADLARHVETCRRCRRRLETLAAEASWWNDAAQLLRPGEDDEPPGRPRLDFLTPSDDPNKLGRLGPYEIEEVIGHGGMGIVLKGYEPQLGRHVAVKVLAPHLATSGAARTRFAREAQAAAAVVHEHVVAIHAVDSAQGLPYLVMPFVPGTSLDHRINESGPMSVSEILRIGMQIAKGLGAAHDQGLVHRDVKPANILLENGVDRVMLTDFGLARAVDDASLTQSGVVAGTPQFMSPEQARGEPLDHRADLFSLGSVMYAMSTGRPPFRADSTLAILRRISDSSPRPIRDVNPSIPEWLAEIIEKLHEKNPADRLQTAAEVARLLGRHLAHLQHPASAPMPPRLAGKRRSWKRIGRPSVRSRVVRVTILLTLLIGVLTVTESLGITHAVRFLTQAFSSRVSDQPANSTAPSPAEALAADLNVPSENGITAETDLAAWDDRFEDDLDEIRRRTDALEDRPSFGSARAERPGRAADVNQSLDQLERELNHAWP